MATPEEMDAQVWPEREYFMHYKVKEQDDTISLSWFVAVSKTAKSAEELLTNHVKTNYKGNKGFSIIAMNRL